MFLYMHFIRIRVILVTVIIALSITLQSCKDKVINPVEGYSTDYGKIPEPPENFNIESISETEMKLSWDDVCNFEEGYKIYKTNSHGYYELITTLSANSTFWIDKNKDKNEAPYYRVTAFTKYQESIPSSVVARWQYFEFIKQSNIGITWKCDYNYNDELIITYNNNLLSVLNSKTLGQNSLITAQSLISSYYVSKTNNYLFYGTDYGKIILYDLNNNSEIKTLNYHQNRVEHLAVSPDISLLISCDTSKIIFYNLNEEKIIKEMDLNDYKVSDMDISNDNKYIVIGYMNKYEKKIELWNLDGFILDNTYVFSKYGGLELQFSKNNELIAVSSGIWEGGSSFLLFTKDFSKANNNYYDSYCSRFSKKDSLLLVCVPDDKNPSIQFYNIQDLLSYQRNFFTDRVFTKNNYWLSVSKNGDQFISCGPDGLLLWNLYNEKRWVKVN